jgi:hypothetical protein
MSDLMAALIPPQIDYASFFGGEGRPKFQNISEAVGQLSEWANQANLARFGEIMGTFEGMGTSGETRIAQGEERAKGSVASDLISKGLFNTTMQPNIDRAIAADAELQRQDLAERIAAQKSGVMERMNTLGPDMGFLSQLIAQAAGSTAGQGTGTIGGATQPFTPVKITDGSISPTFGSGKYHQSIGSGGSNFSSGDGGYTGSISGSGGASSPTSIRQPITNPNATGSVPTYQGVQSLGEDQMMSVINQYKSMNPYAFTGNLANASMQDRYNTAIERIGVKPIGGFTSEGVKISS